MPLSPAESRQAALDILPASGTMSFDEWVDQCVAGGVEREVLRQWPHWRAQGLIHTSVRREGDQNLHLVSRGGV